MITVSLCCQDERGSWTGRATSIHFDEYELETTEAAYPQSGVRIKLGTQREDNKRVLRVGRDIWREIHGEGSGGNIFWYAVLLRGVDAIGLMNYLMKLKWWRSEGGECYLFDQFNAKQPIDPKAFFASRETLSPSRIMPKTAREDNKNGGMGHYP
jgi:hypothetical protein